MLFKEIMFARIRQLPEDKARQKLSQLEPLRRAVSGFTEWSCEDSGYRLKECFLNFESKSIFNSGLIIRQLAPDRWEVEIVLTTPLPTSAITQATDFLMPRNFVNYNYEKHLFYAQPLHFFHSLAYKELSKIQKSDISYYCSHLHGLEVLVYHRQAFMQIVETFPAETEPEARVSLGKKLLNHVKEYLVTSGEKGEKTVVISDDTLKPVDFVDIEQP